MPRTFGTAVARALACALPLCLACGTGAPAPAHPVTVSPIPPSARQLLVVRTPDWGEIHGTLQRFERASDAAPWTPVDAPAAIVVGRTGLAWGRGLHGDGAATEDGPVKHEGDGKSPAGVFALSQVFGYAPADSMPPLRMPYVQATADLRCVDDSASIAYNTFTREPPHGPAPWTSAEQMRRTDDDYRIGVFVDHNAGPDRAPGGGSCIFLHVWQGPDHPTVGCTAMPLEHMTAIVEWLDARRAPVLVQLPNSAYARLRTAWHLP
jgi:L,D-peptidoglycan transpeptidase YkuD (ErfK/YbiS/YcfS/YnhG family)